MKKWIIALAVVAVLAVAFSPATSVFAQSGNGNGFGGGMMGQPGTSSTGTGALSGTLHDYMIAAYADALNLTADEIESRLASGETLSQIALSTGLTLDEFSTLVTEARASAIAAALTGGVITQAQADWLSSHIGGANARGGMMGTGYAYGRSSAAGTGLHLNPNCPYLQSAQ